MKLRSLALLALLITAALPAAAADLVGKWTTEFDSQIGVQKYTYEFKLDGGTLTGVATFDHSFGKGTVPLKAIKVEGDKVAFAETFAMEGNEITISYSGTLGAEEMKLTRNVGDFATEQVVAKRVPAKE